MAPVGSDELIRGRPGEDHHLDAGLAHVEESFRGDLARLAADLQVVGLDAGRAGAGNTGVDVDDGDLGGDLGHHLLLTLDAGGVDHQHVSALRHHRLHLVHLDDRILVGGLEEQLEPLLLGDLLGANLHGREVRRLQLLLGEADDDLVHAGLDAIGRALGGLAGRIDLPAGAQRHQRDCRSGGAEHPLASNARSHEFLHPARTGSTWLPARSCRSSSACGRTAPWPASPRPGSARRGRRPAGRWRRSAGRAGWRSRRR